MIILIALEYFNLTGEIKMDRSEPIELTNLCMIYHDDKILLQNRKKPDWQGYTFPGGHVEPYESFTDAVVREMKEETGLDIKNPKLCGVKQFRGDHGRYVVFLYKTNEYEGNLKSSDEGNMEWVSRSEIDSYNTVKDFKELLEVFDNDDLSEFIYDKDWNVIIK